MLDHVFISVSDIDRSIAFDEKALAPLGIAHVGAQVRDPDGYSLAFVYKPWQH